MMFMKRVNFSSIRSAVSGHKSFPLNLSKRYAGGGSSTSDSNTFYGRCMSHSPVVTSALTAASLWAAGDILAQVLEIYSSVTKSHIFETDRLKGTLLHGFFIGGVASYYWYTFLDKFVVNTLKLRGGSAVFVFAKIGLELMIWHPISLFVYWWVIGKSEGAENNKIIRELRRDYLKTLVGDVCLWTPIGKIPVHLQVLFINIGSLVEAVALSYIHKHGISASTSAPAADHTLSAPAAAHTGDDDDDTIEEQKTSAYRNQLKNPFLNIIFLSNGKITDTEIKSSIDTSFHSLDVNKDGFLTREELRLASTGIKLLPGIQDAAVNEKVVTLLQRYADLDSDGLISKDEYMRFVLKLHAVGYRRKFISDVVFTLFDVNNDGYIDKSELGNFLRVFGFQSNESSVKEILEYADCNNDGKISRDELRVALEVGHEKLKNMKHESS